MSKIRITEKSSYGPIRFEARYSFLQEMFNVAKKKIINKEQDCYQFVGNWIDKNINGDNLELILNIDIFTRFLASGRIIYELDKILFEALSITELDIPCSTLNLPYSTFYIQLGEYSSLFDGVYVDKYISSEDVNGEEDTIWFYFVYKNYAKNKTSLSQLRRDKICGDKLRSCELDISEPNSIIKDILQNEITSSFYIQYSIAERNGTLNNENTQLHLQKEKLESEEILKLFPLVVNLILYINSQNNDVIEDWNKDTPIEKTLRLEKGNNVNERKNLEKGLLEAGYSKVLYVGKNFAKTKEANLLAKALTTGKILSTHFRRGHFRNQPYGKNNLLRKVVFIAPTIVNEGGEMLGKIIKLQDKG
ncbi:hypothetical protein [Caviibacterium pharyngocola]|nr:hypothetical protein [Caviibacterium pharyngocola]